jgi:hypothetical protein
MSDYSSALTAAAVTQTVWPVHETPPQAVQKLEETGSSRTATEGAQTKPQLADDIRARLQSNRSAAFDDRPTGPPPAFQASLLEVESDLSYVIKRVAAAREKARDELAIRTEPAQTQAPVPDAEKSVREANILAPVATPYDVPPEAPGTPGTLG